MKCCGCLIRGGHYKTCRDQLAIERLHKAFYGDPNEPLLWGVLWDKIKKALS